SPLVLEARHRIGGRILTVHDPLTPVPIELGAEFVHGVHPALWRVLRGLHAPVLELTGEHWTRDAEGLHPAGGGWDEMDRIFDEMSRAPEQSFAQFIAGAHASADAKRAATSFVEGFNAAHKEQVSVAWLNEEQKVSDEIQGDRSFRVLAGYGAVCGRLAENLDIRLSTEVSRIRWSPGDVQIETARGESFRCARALIAVPFAGLRCGRPQLDPEPPSLAAARGAIATGSALRVTFRFAESPWNKAAPHLSFLHGDAAFPVWWTAFPVAAPVITGWAAGPNADALAGRSPAELQKIALDSLHKLLGEHPGSPEAAWFHDWSADPFALGAYSYVRTGGLAALAKLQKPVENTICFAGEALAVGHMGTVHGALESGIEAAAALAASVR
ncbi:MAG TPA: NAD(P)/FAD-dependent oxidoreductase, partial [Bryobacteraceae bacterium]|nr:NAD(P)/FAD-dependent oxidoreductase [Bryobacteraceae bacterium]